MSKKSRYSEAENGHNIDISFSILGEGVPCPFQCFIGHIRSDFDSTKGRSNRPPNCIYNQNFYTMERKYTMTEREGLAMVYTLQKVCHYLLGGHFKMFIDHSTLKYLVNKHVLEGNIFRWLLLFQEFNFEVIVKLGRLNAGPDHLSRIEIGEEPSNKEDVLPNA